MKHIPVDHDRIERERRQQRRAEHARYYIAAGLFAACLGLIAIALIVKEASK